MVRILEDTRVLGNKGSKIRFYFSDGTRQDFDISHLYAVRDDKNSINELAEKIKLETGYDSLIVDSGYGKKALQVSVPREVRKTINRMENKLIKKVRKISADDMIRIRFPAYSLIEVEDGKPKFVRMASPDDIKGNIAATDIEMRKNNSDKYNEITMNAIVANSDVYSIALSEFGVKKIPGATVIQVGSENDIANISSAILKKYSIAAHNLPFDFQKLREKTEENFASPDEYAPLFKPVGKFLKIFRIKGKKILDTCSFSRNLLPLVRDNLEPVYNYYFIKEFEKSLDYGEMDKLYELAKDGKDPKAAIKIMKYNIEDAKRCYELVKRQLEVAAPCAIALRTDLTSFFSNSLSTLAMKRRNMQFFYELNACRGNRTRELQDFDYTKEKFDFMKENGIGMKYEFGSIGPTMMAYPTTLLKSMPKIRDDNIDKLYELMRTGDPRDKIVYAQVIDALCEEPFLDMLRCMNPERYYHRVKEGEHLEKLIEEAGEKAKKSYWASYKEKPQYTLARLKKTTEQMGAYITEHGITPVNSAGRFMFFKGPVQNIDSDYLIHYADTNWTISVREDVVAARCGRNIFGFGIDTVAKHGMRCQFEKDTVAKYLEVFPDSNKLKKIIEDGKAAVKNGDVDKMDLAYHIARTKDIYSERTYRSERWKMINDLGLRRGEETYGVWCRTDGRIVGRRVDDVKPDEIAYGKYHNLFFDEGGTIIRFYEAIKPTLLKQTSIDGWSN